MKVLYHSEPNPIYVWTRYKSGEHKHHEARRNAVQTIIDSPVSNRRCVQREINIFGRRYNYFSFTIVYPPQGLSFFLLQTGIPPLRPSAG